MVIKVFDTVVVLQLNLAARSMQCWHIPMQLRYGQESLITQTDDTDQPSMYFC
jgi:hypothetical protein